MTNKSNDIVVPLNVTDSEIQVQVLNTNLYQLGKDKIAQSIVDNHPGVYCFFNEKTIYIGESVHPFRRLEEHLRSGKLQTQDNIIIFRSPQFHKSAIYDIETKLIDYVAAEQKYNLINEKLDQVDYQYFLKESYAPVILEIWEYLKTKGYVSHTISEIEDLEVFKFSPHKALNEDQAEVVKEIKENQLAKVTLIKGYPGTGKSVVASTLYKDLSQKYNTCLTSGTHPTVLAFKRVFKLHQKSISTNSDILQSSHLLKSSEKFDVVIVDEAHRLMKKSGKGHGMKFAHIDSDKDELQMLINKFPHVILLYDENQVVHDGDIEFDETGKKYGIHIEPAKELKEQMRSMDGYNYINFMMSMLNGSPIEYKKSDKYEVKVFDNFSEMHEVLKSKIEDFPLTRLVSGYSRKWISKGYKDETAPYDFEIDGVKLRWNSQAEGWIYSKKAKDLEEIGYYHTVQGFDLHFAGVIIGKDLYLDDNNQIQVDENYVMHTNQKPPKGDPNYHQKLRRWVLNRYKILLSRATRGTYLCIEDKRLREYFKEKLNNFK